MLYDRNTLGKQARSLGFVRDTYEKMCRLTDILNIFEFDKVLYKNLALKGGTAINLAFLNLPRLSVDIDLDFTQNLSKVEMLKERKNINNRIKEFMDKSGYILSKKSKYHYALDSFVFEYTNSAGVKDNLKIEINYMLRSHILPITERKVEVPWKQEKIIITTLNPIEIFATKIVALLTRGAPRDLYDIYNLQKHNLLDKRSHMLRKCAMFYSAIALDDVPKSFSLDSIDQINFKSIRAYLFPVFRREERFDLNTAKTEVKDYLTKVLRAEKSELDFWKAFSQNEYRPDFLFHDMDILKRIENHPMAIWKCQNREIRLRNNLQQKYEDISDETEPMR